jgi:hypothetical protein
MLHSVLETPAAILFLLSGDPHHLDGVADHVGGALLPLGPVGMGLA